LNSILLFYFFKTILDSEIVVVRSNQIELDGRAGRLAEPDCRIRSIKLVFATVPFNSAALDRFLWLSRRIARLFA